MVIFQQQNEAVVIASYVQIVKDMIRLQTDKLNIQSSHSITQGSPSFV